MHSAVFYVHILPPYLYFCQVYILSSFNYIIIKQDFLILNILFSDDEDNFDEGEYEVSENGYHAPYDEDMEGEWLPVQSHPYGLHVCYIVPP